MIFGGFTKLEASEPFCATLLALPSVVALNPKP